MSRHFTGILAAALIALVTSATLPQADAICRVVGEPDSPPPIIQPKQSVLFMKRTNIEVGCDEPEPEADAGSDAGSDANSDGGSDAGSDTGSDTVPIDPLGCEMLPEAVTMVVQPRFTTRSDGAAFALLMVTPAPAHIQLERAEIFRDLAETTAPDVEVNEVFVEDARLGYQCNDPKFRQDSAGCGLDWDSPGGNGNFDPPDGPDYRDPETDEIEVVGPYAVARLSATDAVELASSLTALGYIFLQSDIDAIAPYLGLGFQAVAVRIELQAELVGAGLEPLSFTYPGTEMRLPLGISRQLVQTQTSIALYTLAEGRYQFPGSTVSYASYNRPGEFLTRSNLIATLDRGPEADPIATSITGDSEFRDTVYVDQEIRIPSSNCPRGNDSGCGCRGAPSSGSVALFLITFLAAMLVVRRRRPTRRRARRG